MKWFFTKLCWLLLVKTWKFILKQLIASGSVVTSLYSLRLGLSEYLSVVDPKRGWFSEILTQVMIFPRALGQGKYHHWGLIFCRITRAEGLKMIYCTENFNCSSPGQLVNIPSRIRRFVFYSNKPFFQSSLPSGMK